MTEVKDVSVVIGIDIGLASDHTASLMKDGKRCGRAFSVPPSRSGIDDLVQRARAVRVNEEPLVAVIEPTGHAWVPLAAELQRLGIEVKRPSAALAMMPHGRAVAKCDSKDAERLASYAFTQPDDLHTVEKLDAKRRALKLLLNVRSLAVDESVRLQTAIRGHLQMLHPTLGRLLDRGLTQVERAVIRERLDPFAVVDGGKDAFRSYCAKHARGTLSDVWFEEAWTAYATAAELLEPLHKSGALPVDIGLLQWTLSDLVDQLDQAQERMRKYERRIAETYTQLDAHRVLEVEVPGVGPLIAATLEAHVGDVSRFPNVKAFVKFCGFAPGTRRSGKTNRLGQPITKTGPNLVKKHLYLAAEVARRSDATLAALYSKHLGKHHRHGVTVVAHALARRIYAILKARAEACKTGDPMPKYLYRSPEGTTQTEAEAKEYVAKNFPPGEARRRNASTKTSQGPTVSKAASTVPPVPTSALATATHEDVNVAEASPNDPREVRPTNGVIQRMPPGGGLRPVGSILGNDAVEKLFKAWGKAVGKSESEIAKMIEERT